MEFVIFKVFNILAFLIDFLFHSDDEIQKNAAGVLWNMSTDPVCQNKIRE
jgi:hypothetical protein